jgi:pimeloyl-ACP methyl ester carboxylesterase
MTTLRLLLLLLLQGVVSLAQPLGFQGRMLKVNQRQVHVLDTGKGPTVLLLHPNSGDIASMEKQIRFFLPHHRVVLPEARGHGKSPLGKDSLTYERITEDVYELVQYLHLDSCLVFGWSDGGIVGLRLAMKHPEVVKRLAVYGANLRPDTAAVHAFAINMVRTDLSFFQKRIEANDTTQPWKNLVAQHHLLLYHPHWKAPELKSISCPVLVMSGDCDIIRMRHTIDLFEAIPKAQLCVFPGGTHFDPMFREDRVNSLLQDFFSKPFKRPTSEGVMKGE